MAMPAATADLSVPFDAKKLDPAKLVTLQALVEAGVISHPYAGVRLLGQGEIKVKADFEVHHVSKSAQAAIEKTGGSVKMLKPSPEAEGKPKVDPSAKAQKPKKAPEAED